MSQGFNAKLRQVECEKTRYICETDKMAAILDFYPHYAPLRQSFFFFDILGTLKERYQVTLTKGKQGTIGFWTFFHNKGI